MSQELAALIRRVLSDIAPDVDVSSIDPTEDIRDAADIDSVDFLNFVSALHDETGVDIPERDYSAVRSLDGCERYLAEHSAVVPPT
jgi:acyl carrier protein